MGQQTGDEVQADSRPAQLTWGLIGTCEESAFYSEHNDLVLSTARRPRTVFIQRADILLRFGKAALAAVRRSHLPGGRIEAARTVVKLRWPPRREPVEPWRGWRLLGGVASTGWNLDVFNSGSQQDGLPIALGSVRERSPWRPHSWMSALVT